MSEKRPQQSFIVIFTALLVLALLSVCPWSDWTGGRLKDFNLLGDVMPSRDVAPAGAVAANLDPELAKMVNEMVPEEPADTVDAETADTIAPLATDFKAPRLGDIVLFEDYSADKQGFVRLASTLREAAIRPVRIAMVGDSYIEGDILAQDIRSGLQDKYGGNGVGYMGAFSQFPGFRHSVNQAASGWEEHEIRKMTKDSPLRTILGHYHTAKDGADVRFRGSVKPDHVARWDRTMVVFRAPAAGTITFSGSDNQSEVRQVEGSGALQCVSLEAPSGDVRITSDIIGLEVLGIWLEGRRGIVFDDISLRGNSGVSHRTLNAASTAQMRQWVDYDLIILEFGMNALSEAQKDYTAYGAGMAEVVKNLRSLYPRAQVLVMGVGDRGTKQGGSIISMPTLPAMIRAQREVARQTGAMFYDTREAMGGEGAAYEWNNRKLLNSDFVHLNHRGGKALADIFLQSFFASLQ